jgi:hypothetical protein
LIKSSAGGKVETVAYRMLSAMLLNALELQAHLSEPDQLAARSH